MTIYSLEAIGFADQFLKTLLFAMPYSNISAQMTQDQLDQILSAIGTIKANLPFLINLTPDERQSLRKVGDKLTSYVLDTNNAVNTNARAIPSTIDISEYNKDVGLFFQLDKIISEMIPLSEALSDTSIAVGNEAIRVSDLAYGYLKFAARADSNLNQTVANLGARFKRNRPSESEPVAIPTATNTPATSSSVTVPIEDNVNI